MSDTTQPKILRKALTRIAIWMFLLAACILGYQKLRQIGVDPTHYLGGGDTSGFIAALEETPEGARAVIIKPDGTIVPAPGGKDATIDRDLAWPADGRFLYFVSDRENDQSHVFRWDIGSGNIERKSLDKRTKGATWFPPSSYEDATDFGLMVSGGNVIQFDPKSGEARQLLPPVSKEMGGGDQGAASPFDAQYSRLGRSFKEAKWNKDKTWLAAVMRREAGGEILIVQDTEGKQAPIAVVAGDRIEFDVSPTENKLIYTVAGFDFTDPEDIPEAFIKNGRAIKPFRNGVGVFDPASSDAQGAVALSPDDTAAFSHPRISPDGSTLLMLIGTVDDNLNFQAMALASLPAQPGGMASAAKLVEGKLFDPSWGPDGQTIVYVRETGGRRSIFQVGRDGSGEKNLTGTKGDFFQPIMSPVVPQKT